MINVIVNSGRHMHKCLLAAFVLCVVMMSVAIAGKVDERQAAIRALLDQSGLTEVIEQVPFFILAGTNDSLREQHPDLSRDELVVMKDILQRSFASDVILRNTVAQMEAHYDGQRIASVLKRLASPLGTKMTDLEKSASTPEAYNAMLEYARTLESAPPDASRVAILTELDRASHTTELTVAMQLEIFSAILRVMNAYAGEQGALHLNDEELAKTIDLMAEQTWEKAQEMTLLSFLFTYQKTGDAELRDYIALHNDEDMQWYLALSSSALINALSRAMGKASQEIVRHLKGTERLS